MAPSHLSSRAGIARIAFVQRGTTRLAELFQQAPLRVLRPRVPPGEPPCAVLVNTSGGIVGGDALRVAARLEPGAGALITSQAAEKAYRSGGREATLAVDLALAAGTVLEWLPQETILFDGARLRRRLRADLDADARLLAADMLVFGRQARGETFASGLLHDRWEVRVGGRLVWADALALTPAPGAVLDLPFTFGGARACAMALYVAADAGEQLALARELAAAPAVRSGATCLGRVLLVRWLAADPAPLRKALQRFCAGFRQAALDLPVRFPAIWQA